MSLLRTDASLSKSSYYAATAPRAESHAPLHADLDCDVAVVGGGLAGLSAAIELAGRGFKVVLLEAREIGAGASGRNGGQVIAGLACDPATIEQQLGLPAARQIWDMTLEAVRLMGARRERFQIDCDWQAGHLSVAIGARKAAQLQAWQQRMQQVYGYDTRWIGATELPDWIASARYRSGLFDARGGHLHPLKYSRGLARAASGLGVQMHEHSAVTRIEPGATTRLRTATGSVRAAHVLLAGNVYLAGLAPALARRIMPVATFIVATQPLGAALAHSLIPSQAAVCDTNFVLDYFRPTPDHRLLYGGGVSYSTAAPPRLAQSMHARICRTFPQLRATAIDFSWGGFVDISMNRAPDFGRLADVGGPPSARNIYYLQGFSGHGLALTGLAGRLVAEAIAGTAERFDTFARIRHRPFPGGRWLRTPALVVAMAYYGLKDLP